MVKASATPASRARHRVRTHVSEYPGVYLRFARHKYPGPSPEVIGPDTELVIDGFTRSATTFAVYAFQLAQDRPVRLAHHLHAPAQLIEAARRAIPTLALIRRPQEAVLSQLVREPDVALRDALIAYCRFYECLLPYRDAFVVGEFDTVTHDFGSVVRRINDRFGTSFAEFQQTDEGMRECFQLIEYRGTLSDKLLGFESGVVTRAELAVELDDLACRSASIDTREAWKPSGARDQSKDALREQWSRANLATLRERATAVFEQFRAGNSDCGS
jgi:hypothetical protein